MSLIEDEDEAPEEVFEYDPIPERVHEDAALIFDPVEFAERFHCYCAIYQGGALFVLDRDTLKWRNVEEFGKPDSPKLKRVQ